MAYSHLIAVLLFFTFTSAEAVPRMDLYQKIKRETGVSLKEAFQAVDGKNSSAATNLQLYAKRAGIKEIEKVFEAEIAKREEFCKKKKSPSCDETVENLKSQIKLLRELSTKYETLDRQKKLYYSLIVYNFNIKLKVLKDDFLDWEKNCSAQEKINTKPCQEKLFESHVLTDIARDLGLVVLERSNKQPADAQLIKSIKDRISRYEKL